MVRHRKERRAYRYVAKAAGPETGRHKVKGIKPYHPAAVAVACRPPVACRRRRRPFQTSLWNNNIIPNDENNIIDDIIDVHRQRGYSAKHGVTTFFQRSRRIIRLNDNRLPFAARCALQTLAALSEAFLPHAKRTRSSTAKYAVAAA